MIRHSSASKTKIQTTSQTDIETIEADLLRSDLTMLAEQADRRSSSSLLMFAAKDSQEVKRQNLKASI